MITIYSGSWRAMMLRGILAVLFGVLALALPGVTIGVLVLLFGAFVLLDGFFAFTAGLRTHREQNEDKRWGILLMEGVAGILVGLFTFLSPGITLAFLLAIVAAWAIITGVIEIWAAVQLRASIKGEIFLALSGVLSILLGIFVLAQPAISALAFTMLLGAYAVFFGILLLALSLRLRSLDTTHHLHHA
jgi:uncharacterized membrane protein HdeD (DUF308 family)